MRNLLQWRLVRRAAVEHRIAGIALAGLILLNVLAYVLFVYPLSQRVNNVASLTSSAENELAKARLEHTQASNLVTGRARSTEKLETFYRDVLPRDAAMARQIASPRLYQIAMAAGVHPQSINAQPLTDRDNVLTQLEIRMDLTGTYDGIRRFIHLLERATEFVTVINMRVIERPDADGELDAQLDLATYYKGTSR
jgi:Tfp pilus assembly protein PilO